MSSQTIATSTRGLPDFASPPVDLSNFAASSWPDIHPSDSNPDEEVNEDEVNEAQENKTSIANRPSWSEMDTQQRNQAVGNLLAALAPVSPTQTAIAPTKPDLVPPPDQTIDAVQIKENDTTAQDAGVPNSPRHDVDTNHHALLPPLPPLATDDFLDETEPPPLAPTIVMDPPDPSQVTLVGSGNAAMVSHGESQRLAPAPAQEPLPERREIEAFAKIEFEDGNYYITTYACELGRDAFAYRAALARAEEARQAKQDRAQSSSGRRSGLSEGIPRPGDSQVQGSVVSEAGGFGGVDDGPGLENGPEGDAHPMNSHSSEMSAGSVVKPQEVLINPPLIPFDYHKMAERQAQFEHNMDQDPDNEQPAPVTADHIPDAHNCPLIPIHAMRNFQKSEVENHRSISRRHVKIQWDFDRECFQMKVLGRNGAFLDDQYLPRGGVKRLRDGTRIQISNVWMTFRLPNQKAESPSEDSGREEPEPSPIPKRSTSPTPNEQDRSVSPSRTGKTKAKLTLTVTEKASPTIPDPMIGLDGQPMPPRKRGPGRPPKDGIMSTRERREREKAQKLAEAKAANGGRTPPPSMRSKLPKPVVQEEVVTPEPKPEKRKYKKRKRSEADGDIVQSIEGGEIDVPSEVEKPPPVKKARQSKSPSPEYPPAETLTEEQLARPSEPYARLIYDILLDIHPKALPLKQIYRALKLKFPFFVHRVDSEGWQSSVRHNLNQEWNKLFEKGEKEGKGFAWKAIPGALQPQAERRRAAQQAAAAKPKPPPAPRQHPPQGPPPMLNWQNSTAYPQQNGMPPRGAPPPFFVQGPHGPMPPPPNGMAWPPPPPPGGMPSSASPNPSASVPSPMPPGPNSQSFYPPAQGGRPPFPSQPPPQSGSTQPAPSTNQGPPRPASATSTPVPPSIPSSSSASRNMPCTTDGLMAIRRFETAMYEQVGDHAKIEQWQRVFASVKRRLLHGHPESSLPGGETREELTIMEHMKRFIERFKNPNFVGFSKEPTKGTASPAPTPAPPAHANASNTNAQSLSTHPAPVSTAAGATQKGPTQAVQETLKVESRESQPPTPSEKTGPGAKPPESSADGVKS